MLAAKVAKSNAVTETERSKNRATFLKEQLKEKESKAKEATKENASSVKQSEKLSVDLERVQAQRAAINHDPIQENEWLRAKQDKYDEMVQVQEVRWAPLHFLHDSRKWITSADNCQMSTFVTQIHIPDLIAKKSRVWWPI